MKFGRRLQDESVPGWRYVDYSGLKEMLKEILHKSDQTDGNVPGHKHKKRNFAQRVKDEILAVEAFFLEKQKAAMDSLDRLEDDLFVIEGWIESDYPDTEQYLDKMQKDFTNLGLDVAKLLHFLDLNVTAIRKILKKYDHVTGHHAGPGLLTDSEGSIMERLSDPFELSEMVLAIQAGLSKTYFLRSRLYSTAQNRRVLAPNASSRTTSVSSANDSDDEAGRIRSSSFGVKKEDLKIPRERGVSEQRNKRLLQLDSSELAMSWTVKSLEEEEQDISFESFVSKQLLVSEKSHQRLANTAEVQHARDSRRRNRESRWNMMATRRNAQDTHERGPLLNNLLDEDRTGLAFHVFITMIISALYTSNVAALIPFMDVYAEASKTEIDTSALAFATLFASSWLCMYSLLNMSRKGLFVPLCISAVALAVGNLAHAEVFSAFFTAFNTQEVHHTDLILFSAMGLIGVGGFLANVLPASLCTRPSLVLSHKLETVSACLVLANLAGAVFGRGLTSVGSSLKYTIAEEYLGVHANSYSFSTMLFAAAWSMLFILIAGPMACSAFAVPFFRNAADGSERHGYSTLVAQPSSVWGGVLEIESNWFGGAFRPRGGISWFAALLLQVVTSFSITSVEAMVSVTLNSIFLLNWPSLSIVTLGAACLPVIVLPWSWFIVRRVGSWFTLRVSIAVIALTACFLLPLEGLTASYSISWFVVLSTILTCLTYLVQFVSCEAVSKNLEMRFGESPLHQYGMLGPMISIQTARYFGSLSAYLVLAYSFYHGASNPAYVLTSVYSCIAILCTLSFFVLLWEEY